MRIKIILALLLILATCVLGKVSLLEYTNQEQETVRRLRFRGSPILRANGRIVEIDLKKIDNMEIFADSMEIYFGDTWVKVSVTAATKDTVLPPPFAGWMKISTGFTGVSDKGKITVPILELTRATFKYEPKPEEEASEENVEEDAQGDGEELAGQQIEDEQAQDEAQDGGVSGDEQATDLAQESEETQDEQ